MAQIFDKFLYKFSTFCRSEFGKQFIFLLLIFIFARIGTTSTEADCSDEECVLQRPSKQVKRKLHSSTFSDLTADSSDRRDRTLSRLKDASIWKKGKTKVTCCSGYVCVWVLLNVIPVCSFVLVILYPR